LHILSKWFLHGFLYFVVLSAVASEAAAYTVDNHRQSVVAGAALCESQHGLSLPNSVLIGMIDGVLEPDQITPSTFQMVLQRVEPGSRGRQRRVSLERIAAQSLHGSPNPTRTVYSNSAVDRAALRETTARNPAELSPDRYDIDVYSYDTNLALRNKLLINASQFLCVSFAHRDPEQAGRKFGNMIHMIGDTYSASHVQRTPPTGRNGDCGTEKIEWHFSMDLVSWKQHTPADKETGGWRFRCLVSHTSELIRLWIDGRSAAMAASTEAGKMTRSQAHVTRSLRYLCRFVLREDEAVLQRPAGGAAVGFSSASGTDNWAILAGPRRDRSIEPVGLTGEAEARAFHRDVAARLKRRGSQVQYSYPSRQMGDLCKALSAGAAVPEPLRCTSNEIGWAMAGDEKVRSMWIPARPLP